VRSFLHTDRLLENAARFCAGAGSNSMGCRPDSAHSEVAKRQPEAALAIEDDVAHVRGAHRALVETAPNDSDTADHVLLSVLEDS
jgi:hypothetical protein